MKVINLPTQCSKSIYQDAITEYIELISAFDEVLSVVQIGNVGVAGISDIDLIVYLDNAKKCSNNYSLYQISKQYHQILLHDVFIIPYHLINKSFLITSIFDTKTLYGKELRLDPEIPLNKTYERLIFLNDIAIVSLLHEYEFWDEVTNKDIKLIIARINSIRYPIVLLKKVADYYNINLDTEEVYNKFVAQFTNFRKGWFKTSENENIKLLLEFLKRARYEIAPKLIDDIVTLNKNVGLFNCCGDKISFRLGNGILEGDTTLFLNLLYYSHQQGLISEHIKQNLLTNIKISSISPRYKLMLNDRINLINECYEFREKCKIPYGEFWTFGKSPRILLYEKIITRLKRIANVD